MNTPLEERFKSIISTYSISSMKTDDHIKKCIAITEEIAIGFSKWCEENGWSWSIDHQLYLHYDGKSLGKNDRELFALYMEESLKP